MTGGLAALVPDADVFIRSAADPLLAVEYHRHFTHALAFAPVGAAVVTSFWWMRRAWRAQGLALRGCATLAYVSHCLLDTATSYGTQLLWPLSNRRFGWDLISVIDPFFTLALALGLGLAMWRQRVKPTAVALAFCAGYLALGAVQHSRAVAAQAELARARGHAPARVEVMPTLGNNLIWRALYEHEGQIYSDRLRVGWFSAPAVREGWALAQVGWDDLTEAEQARNRQRSFERFAWFSEGWVARSPTDASVLGDMRYSLSTAAFDPIWGIRFTAPGAPTEVDWVNRSRDREVKPGELWREIVGADERYRKL